MSKEAAKQLYLQRDKVRLEMKKLIICLFVVLLFGAIGKVRAQVWDGQLVVRAGFSADIFKGHNTVGLEMLPSYNVSVDFNKDLSKGFFWDAGLMFGTRGWDDADSKAELRAHNLSIAPALGFKYHLTANCAGEMRLGTFFSVDMAGKLKDDEGHDTKLSDLDDYNRCDGGIIFALGVWYKKINIDYTFKRGFAKLWDDGPEGAVNHWIRLGYAF